MEYQSEMEYEKEKASVIAEQETRVKIARDLLNTFGIEKELEEFKFVEKVLRLLKNSKWINAYPTADDLKKAKKIAFEDGYNSGYGDGEDDATDYLD